MRPTPHRTPALALGVTFAPLPTERLLIRVVAEDDLDGVHAYQSREDVCRFLLYEPRDRAAVAATLAASASRTSMRDAGDSLQLAVARREDDAIVGELYLAIDSVAHACVEIGWIFNPAHGGRGYATEAARALLRFAFETLHAHRVVARLHPGNAASVAMCDRLGMRREAHHVQDMWVKGAWEDNGVHALLRDEWEQRAPAVHAVEEGGRRGT